MTPLFVAGLILLVSPCMAEAEADLKTKCQNDPSCYWWTGQDSPFKRAAQKEAHIKNSASFNTGISPNNPFFNGGFEKLPQNSGFVKQEEKVDLSKNPFFNTNKELFPTAHPAQIVPNEQNKHDYSNNPFLQNMYTANGSQISRNKGIIGVQPKPFSTRHPLEGTSAGKLGEDDDYTLDPSSYRRKCEGDDVLCVPVGQCPNGVIPDYISNGLQGVKDNNEICDLRFNACCRTASAGKSQEVKVVLPNFDGQYSTSNSSFITAGKSSLPESLIKFGGVPGFSPGLIQVVPVEINNAGEFGSSHRGESTQKPVRDISSSTRNSVFGSTPDYSNYNFEDVRFASSIQGPAYLPPLNGPTPPSVSVPDLEVPVSTYVPSFPTQKPYVPTYTTQKPYVPSFPTQKPYTRPSPRPFEPNYSPSFNNQYVTPKPQQPFIPEYLPPSTPRPYVPPSTIRPTPPPYRPLPSPSSPIPSQRPTYFQPSPQPTSDRDYLPPVIPTSSSNVNNQYRPFPSPPAPTFRPRPPPTFIPTTSNEYLPPRTPSKVKPYQPSYQPSPSTVSPFTSSYKPTPSYSYKPPATSPRPTIIYQPSQTIPQSTYNYEKPTPGYTYPKPTSGYSYPTPTPSFNYPTTQRPTTQRPLIPSSTFNIPSTYKPSTFGYDYPKPSPSPSYINTQKVQTTPRPTAGYDYPKPTPEFTYQSSSPTNVSPVVKPIPTQRPRPRPTQSYLPPTQPTPGYSYPKPTPTFGYPDRDGAPGNTNNQYIPPPRDKDGSDTSDTSVKVKPRPEITPDQTINNENIVPPSACAAALKCVQEIYCSAEGVVSPVPVVLTKEQAENKVPTTVCRDIGSGTLGVCCRDPNYKDPWPSANLVNGFDDGQYKEDDSIGQYKQTLNDIAQYRRDLSRPSRSHSRRVSPSGPVGSNENLRSQSQQETCGTRHENSSPKGPGPLNTDFAEIPWQAMILRDSNRSLLCGGAIIKRNAVLTNAHCLDGLPTSDILVKGGEWKLGIDEEPLPFQIVKVSVILRHPGYKPGSMVNDLAILILEEKLRPAKNIGTICLPEPNQIPTRNCIATGWGKRILQLHAKGAVMRSIGVDIMDNKQCEETLSSTYQNMMPHYSPNTLCGFSAQDQCKVDYGSALACKNEANRYVLSGIFAWDTGCKDQNQIGGYVAPDVEWINDSLAKPLKVLRKLENAQ